MSRIAGITNFQRAADIFPELHAYLDAFDDELICKAVDATLELDRTKTNLRDIKQSHSICSSLQKITPAIFSEE